jgi:hypothetical protein
MFPFANLRCATMGDMAVITGKCHRCGDDNPYTNIVCSGCGSRLPWADALDEERRQRIAAQHAAAQANQAAQQAQQKANRDKQTQPQQPTVPAQANVTSSRVTLLSSRWALWGIVIILFATRRLACFPLETDLPNDEEPTEGQIAEHEKNLSSNAYYAAEENIKNQLKAPSTAEFAGYNKSVVTKVGPGDTFKIESYVDAQNSFGAKLRARWTATAIYKNGSWETKAFLNEPDL